MVFGNRDRKAARQTRGDAERLVPATFPDLDFAAIDAERAVIREELKSAVSVAELAERAKFDRQVEADFERMERETPGSVRTITQVDRKTGEVLGKFYVASMMVKPW